MNDDIFDQLAERGQHPPPSRPQHLHRTVDQLRADVAALPGSEVAKLIAVAEDVHHAQVIHRWSLESEGLGASPEANGVHQEHDEAARTLRIDQMSESDLQELMRSARDESPRRATPAGHKRRIRAVGRGTAVSVGLCLTLMITLWMVYWGLGLGLSSLLAMAVGWCLPSLVSLYVPSGRGSGVSRVVSQLIAGGFRLPTRHVHQVRPGTAHVED